MNTPNVKDILRGLSFLKSNMALMLPIGIVFAGGLSYIPTHLMRSALQNKIQAESVDTGNKFDRLVNQVPPTGLQDSLQEYVQSYAEDANRIDAMIKHCVDRELLSYRLFPDTNETSPLLFRNFGERYRAGIERLLEDVGAGDVPPDADIYAALESTSQTMMGGRGMAGGRGMTERMPAMPEMGRMPVGGRATRGMGMTLGWSTQLESMGEVERKIVETICMDRARALKVYATPANFGGYAYWGDWVFEDRNQAYRDCWYWQLGYWILEDVVATVEAMNANAASVLQAPVKRIIDISFVLTDPTAMMGRGMRSSSTRDEAGGRPFYATNTRDALTVPCTGRFCGDAMDVVHFSLTAVVRSRDVVLFIQELCGAKEHQFRGWRGDEPPVTYKHNQISVLESNLQPTDPEGLIYDHSLHRYGDEPVVMLDLICEYIFDNTESFVAIKPQQAKNDLEGIEDEED